MRCFINFMIKPWGVNGTPIAVRHGKSHDDLRVYPHDLGHLHISTANPSYMSSKTLVILAINGLIHLEGATWQFKWHMFITAHSAE